MLSHSKGEHLFLCKGEQTTTCVCEREEEKPEKKRYSEREREGGRWKERESWSGEDRRAVCPFNQLAVYPEPDAKVKENHTTQKHIDR